MSGFKSFFEIQTWIVTKTWRKRNVWDFFFLNVVMVLKVCENVHWSLSKGKIFLPSLVDTQCSKLGTVLTDTCIICTSHNHNNSLQQTRGSVKPQLSLQLKTAGVHSYSCRGTQAETPVVVSEAHSTGCCVYQLEEMCVVARVRSVTMAIMTGGNGSCIHLMVVRQAL